MDVALGHAARLLEKDPALAAEQASEILKAVPGHPHARLILRCRTPHHRSDAGGARWMSRTAVAREQPRSAPAHMELGIALGEAGRAAEALAALRRALQLKPDSADGWRLLADQLDAASAMPRGGPGPRALHQSGHQGSATDGGGGGSWSRTSCRVAEARLRIAPAQLSDRCRGAAHARRSGGAAARYADAQALLERCLELAPSFDAARHNYAVVLNRQGKAAAALPQVEQLLAKEPRNPGYLNLKAAVLANLGDYGESIEVYEARARGVSAAAEDLDELWPFAEDRGPPGGQHGCLPPRHRHGADAWARPTGAWPI